jgi:hypothetical protein
LTPEDDERDIKVTYHHYTSRSTINSDLPENEA